jgi:hypothetical protein
MSDPIDAVIVPDQWRGNVDDEGLYIDVKKEFGAAMGATADPNDVLYMRRDTRGGGRVLVTHHPDHMMKFDKNHPKYKMRDRYVWREGPEGALIGTLTDEARAEWEATHPA